MFQVCIQCQCVTVHANGVSLGVTAFLQNWHVLFLFWNTKVASCSMILFEAAENSRATTQRQNAIEKIFQQTGLATEPQRNEAEERSEARHAKPSWTFRPCCRCQSLPAWQWLACRTPVLKSYSDAKKLQQLLVSPFCPSDKWWLQTNGSLLRAS